MKYFDCCTLPAPCFPLAAQAAGCWQLLVDINPCWEQQCETFHCCFKRTTTIAHFQTTATTDDDNDDDDFQPLHPKVWHRGTSRALRVCFACPSRVLCLCSVSVCFACTLCFVLCQRCVCVRVCVGEVRERGIDQEQRERRKTKSHRRRRANTERRSQKLPFPLTVH